MNLQILFENIHSSPELESLVRSKFAKLEKYNHNFDITVTFLVQDKKNSIKIKVHIPHNRYKVITIYGKDFYKMIPKSVQATSELFKKLIKK
ncbi:MAG: HPF/RaiA family ribosome-associated protein [Candidatus Dojkabacteria bacterium]|nr:HPF/RaiA family ribosome-associated protein [Candidatus Dojkabacteria bacterium]